MKLGVTVRVMGPQSSPELVRSCAVEAEAAGLDSLWVADHIAIPPDDAEGSGGRYLDPLATLAFLAGITERIMLGTGVLVLPYRPPLATAKWIATIQELSAHRLLLGIGVGWMEAEFRALGIDRRHRGAQTDAMLSFLHRCFTEDIVAQNGQPFLFKPRPPRPPIYVGGRPPHALKRTLAYGDGWFPMRQTPQKLAPHIASLRETAAAEGKSTPEVVALTALPLDELAAAEAMAREYARVGVTHLVHGMRYDSIGEFRRNAALLARTKERLGTDELGSR